MAEEGLITYENIYEILRLEKYKKELQKLDPDFFNKVTRYINEKRIILQGYEVKDSVFASQSITKIKKQLENIQLLLKELYEKRENKIIQMAMYNSRVNATLQDSDVLLHEEKELYESLISNLNSARNGILNSLLEGKKPEVKLVEKKQEVKEPNKLIRFLETVPKFMGEDMTIYGPFNPEDIGNLPEKISLILIKNKKAEEI